MKFSLSLARFTWHSGADACSTWHSKADSASADATPPVAEAVVSLLAVSDAANPSTGTAEVSANAATDPSGVHTADPSSGTVVHLWRQLMPPQPCVLRALQQVLPQHQQIQPPPHQVSRCKHPHRHYLCLSRRRG